jgi:hypothetical protein
MITEKMFVTAEDCMSPIAGIWVMLTTFSVKVTDLGIIPAVFVITTSTGYRAELTACYHEDGMGEWSKRTPCTCRLRKCEPWNASTCNKRGVCHGYHLVTAETFRDRVAQTYRGK